MKLGEKKIKYQTAERSLDINKKKLEFSKYIKDKQKEYLDKGKPTKTRTLADMLGIENEMFRKIVNMNKPTNKRDCIIAICAALRLDSEEANCALTLYNCMPILNPVDERDDELINIIEEQTKNKLTIDQINMRLKRNGYPELNIIDHRKKPDKVTTESSPYRLVSKQVVTSIDEILYDRYNSLETEYGVNRYSYYAKMVIVNDKTNNVYKLVTRGKDDYLIQNYSVKNDILGDQESISIDEAGDMRDLFIELESMVKREEQKLLATLNDTKNYKERISANIKDDRLHVFIESFNYVIPELNEYYLLEYTNTKYKMTVCNKSIFMYHYLGEDLFREHYGEVHNNHPISIYETLEDINEETIDPDSDYLIKYQKRVFNELKDKVDSLMVDLKERRIFIRNLNDIYEPNKVNQVCYNFGVEKEFECTIDDHGTVSTGKTKHDFIIDDNQVVTISLDDLYRAFELGFHNIDEICKVKIILGSVEAIIS